MGIETETETTNVSIHISNKSEMKLAINDWRLNQQSRSFNPHLQQVGDEIPNTLSRVVCL